jgi:glycosyltransferase involved in cell wall biosynthesis
LTPEISVVVPSQDRPVRLRWLLNALEEQTLPSEQFEVVVAHDSKGPETAQLLRTHPLAEAGVLRSFACPPGRGPGGNRNAGWRGARASIVAFTDDDCRPPPNWLGALLDAARAHPGAIVQGATRPDPLQAELLHASPYVLTQDIDPPNRRAETCNIAYPRAVLERLDGFDERLITGEDTDLWLRARAAGVELAGAPEALTFHAVVPLGLAGAVRATWRWRYVPCVVGRHPSMRRHLPLGMFWSWHHPLFLLGLTGVALARRRRAFALLALPWAVHALPSYGPSARGRVRAVLELPTRAGIHLAEIVTLASGSVRCRTIFL